MLRFHLAQSIVSGCGYRSHRHKSTPAEYVPVRVNCGSTLAVKVNGFVLSISVKITGELLMAVPSGERK